MGALSLVNQLAVFLVTSALDRRIDSLSSITESVVRTDQASRPPVMERTIDLFYRDSYPGIEILLARIRTRDPLSGRRYHSRAAERMEANQRRVGARRALLFMELRSNARAAT